MRKGYAKGKGKKGIWQVYFYILFLAFSKIYAKEGGRNKTRGVCVV
jgi:hypothetical protein